MRHYSLRKRACKVTSLSHWVHSSESINHTHTSLTPGVGGRPAVCAGSAPASARWGHSAARHDPGPAPRKSAEGSRTAGARGGSDAPSRRTRKSTLAANEEGKSERRRRDRRGKSEWKERKEKKRDKWLKTARSTSSVSCWQMSMPPFATAHTSHLIPLFSIKWLKEIPSFLRQ